MNLKIKLAIFMLFIAIFLVGCNAGSTSEEGTTEDIKGLVHEYSVGEFNDQTASITSTELIITNSDESETVYPLPEEEFFVSIAPFIKDTHP